MSPIDGGRCARRKAPILQKSIRRPEAGAIIEQLSDNEMCNVEAGINRLKAARQDGWPDACKEATAANNPNRFTGYY